MGSSTEQLSTMSNGENGSSEARYIRAELEKQRIEVEARARKAELEGLKEFFAALLEEREKAMHLVVGDQHGYFMALLDERTKATLLASGEREKAAVQLRENLERQISAGDHSLERHITEQIASVRAALTAQERQLASELKSREMAIEKSEASYRERFASVNEFRATLSDQVQGFMPREVAESRLEQMSKERQELTDKLTGLLPIEVFKSALEEWTRWRVAVDKQLYEEIGLRQGVKATTGTISALIAGAVGVITIIIVLANVFTGS